MRRQVIAGLSAINDARRGTWAALYGAVHGLGHLGMHFDRLEHHLQSAEHERELHLGEDTISGVEGSQPGDSTIQ